MIAGKRKDARNRVPAHQDSSNSANTLGSKVLTGGDTRQWMNFPGDVFLMSPLDFSYNCSGAESKRF